MNLGGGREGKEVEAAVEIINRTGRPVRVYGGTSDCSGVVTADLPLVLAPGEARGVTVRARLSGSVGYFNRKAWFWTDSEEAPAVYFALVGRIEPARAGDAAASVK